MLGIKLAEAQQADEKTLLLWIEVFENNVWHKVDPESQTLIEQPEHYLGLRIVESLSDLRGDNLSALLYEGQGLQVGIALK